MKVYIVYNGFPQHVFLSRDKAEQYVRTFNTSPYEVDWYRISEMDTVDDMMDILRIGTIWWFNLEYPSKSFYVNSKEINSLNNMNDFTSGLSSDITYKEVKYHNSEKVRIRSLSGCFYVEKREASIDREFIKEKIKSKIHELMLEIIQRRDKKIVSIEDIESWLKKEPLAQLEKINDSLYEWTMD